MAVLIVSLLVNVDDICCGHVGVINTRGRPLCETPRPCPVYQLRVRRMVRFERCSGVYSHTQPVRTNLLLPVYDIGGIKIGRPDLVRPP